VTVSRRHAEIRRKDNAFHLEDVGSLNGTFVNRHRVESAPLSSGDEIQIGKFKLVFFTGGPPRA
jgi:pSer/pThr/pTyr-binding forkhead associated (FHA) protein